MIETNHWRTQKYNFFFFLQNTVQHIRSTINQHKQQIIWGHRHDCDCGVLVAVGKRPGSTSTGRFDAVGLPW